MTDLDFYQRLLDLPGLRITAVDTQPRRILIYATLSAEPTPCPVCGEPTGLLHQYERRKVQDLSISGKEVWLHLRVPQLACLTCPPYFVTPPAWIMPGKSYTRRQAKWIFEMCAKQPFTEVAALVGLSHKTVERLYYDMAQEHIDLAGRYARVRKLGIDEVSHRKGKRDFVCVLTDLERGVQLDILPNRRKETLAAHFKALGPAFCAQIEVVACDMWRPYRDVAEECFPGAELVIDRFHVVKALNEALDRIRKQLRRAYADEGCFKGIKWALFKRAAACSAEEHTRLEEALARSPRLREAYRLRNAFHELMDTSREREALARGLASWAREAERLGSAPVTRFVGTLRRWLGPISAFASTGLTNAVTEGLNNYLRYFKRISFGLPNFAHMRVRVLMATA
ncbi:MAG: ISL3 family transposase [Bacteroidota bacterium]